MSRSKKLPKVLTPDEQERLLGRFNLRYPTPHRNRTMVLTMLDAGLRVGEVVALKPDHLDLGACRITVREGKGAKDRVVHIPRRLRDALSDWLPRMADFAAWVTSAEASLPWGQGTFLDVYANGAVRQDPQAPPERRRQACVTGVYVAASEADLGGVAPGWYQYHMGPGEHHKRTRKIAVRAV